MECGYRSLNTILRRRWNAPSVSVALCHLKMVECVASHEDVDAVQSGVSCDRCAERDPDAIIKLTVPRSLGWLMCPARGEPTGEELTCECSIDRAIYSCSRKGRCIKKLPSGTTLIQLGPIGEELTVCRDCPESSSEM